MQGLIKDYEKLPYAMFHTKPRGCRYRHINSMDDREQFYFNMSYVRWVKFQTLHHYGLNQ